MSSEPVSEEEVEFVSYHPIKYVIVGTMVIRFGSLYDPKYYKAEVKRQAAKRGVKYVVYKNSSYHYHRLDLISRFFTGYLQFSSVLRNDYGFVFGNILESLLEALAHGILEGLLDNYRGSEKQIQEATVLLLAAAKDCETKRSLSNDGGLQHQYINQFGFWQSRETQMGHVDSNPAG